MESNPLVSIVMNCYNSDLYLKEAVDSVVGQTYQNWEIVFWDNQSTDSSTEIIKSYSDKRIRYFYAPKFTPLGEARNLAIDKCSGEWIAFLDCDDLWDRDKLKISMNQLDQIKNRESISLIYSKSYTIDKSNNILATSLVFPLGDIYKKLLKEGNFIIFSSAIARKNILIDCGKIDESLSFCEDYDLLLRVCKGHQALGIDQYLASYRMHENNITSRKIHENIIELVEFLNEYAVNNHLSVNIKAQIHMNNSYGIFKAVIKLLLASRYKESASLTGKYISYLPLYPIAIIKVKIIDQLKKLSLP